MPEEFAPPERRHSGVAICIAALIGTAALIVAVAWLYMSVVLAAVSSL